MKSDKRAASDPDNSLAGRNLARGFTLLAASSALPNREMNTRFESFHLFYPVSAFSQDYPRLQVNLVPLFIREVSDTRPGFLRASKIKSTCRLAGGERARVRVQVGFPNVSQHSSQIGYVFEHSISLFHVFLVEDVLSRDGLWRPFPVGLRG